MEYLLGSLLTIFAMLFANKLLNKQIKSVPVTQIVYRQSIIHDILRPFLPTNNELSQKSHVKTQSKIHSSQNSLRVLFSEDKAYWIKDNIFYTADLLNGLVDEETTTRVDIMGMNEVQLKEMSFIVDKLTEGIDDENRYSGK
jgi:hypothetical protein